MVTSTDRLYGLNDVVHVHPVPGDSCNYGTILGYADPDHPGDVDGSGPLYLVNIGNVFGHGGMYEYVLPESRLYGLIFRESECPHGCRPATDCTECFCIEFGCTAPPQPLGAYCQPHGDAVARHEQCPLGACTCGAGEF